LLSQKNRLARFPFVIQEDSVIPAKPVDLVKSRGRDYNAGNDDLDKE
jgi:hypothetical protein